MLRISELKLPLDHPAEALPAAIAARLGVDAGDILRWSVWKRAHDARKKAAILKVYIVDAELKDEAAVLERMAGDPQVRPTPDTAYQPVATAPAGQRLRPVVIGAGPCGLFAGLILAEMGFRPIILDRGKAVRERTKDTWGLWRKGELDPESNVQFGEGGAGTFSDGKLYSQIKDPRFLGRKVLTEFVEAGAPEEILTEAHPHIGTFRLVTMVESLRAKIEALGGEYRWGHRVTDIELDASGACAASTCRPASSSRLTRWSSPSAIRRATPSRPCTPAASTSRPSPSPSASASSTRSPGSTRRCSGPAPAIRTWGPRPIPCRTTARTGGRSTASACARAGRWWRRRRSRAAWSPTA
jgi:hypothetical protein